MIYEKTERKKIERVLHDGLVWQDGYRVYTEDSTYLLPLSKQPLAGDYVVTQEDVGWLVPTEVCALLTKEDFVLEGWRPL